MKENKNTKKQKAPDFPTNVLDIPSLPKILVTRSSLPPFEEYVEEIRDIWDSRWLTNMGMKHQQLQRELCRYLDVENIDLLTNGHMALELGLQALDLSGEVITTPFTFVSTTHAIVRNGLTPVFCDVKYDDYTIDESRLEALITEKTCAIVPVHVYGNICNVEQIQKIADKYGLKVLYDAAHAFGETWKGRGIGSFGDVSCFSFHATKVYNTIEGGAVCFHDPEYGYTIARLKNFGIRGPEIVDGIGANAKMNEFCAAMGLCNLRHVDQEIARRREVAVQYREALGSVPGLKLNCEQPDVRNNYAYFPVVFDEGVFGANRNQVFEKLLENGINARKYFYPLTNAMDCYRGRFDPGQTPTAQYLADRVLTLPFYPDLDRETVERICDIILSCRRTV